MIGAIALAIGANLITYTLHPLELPFFLDTIGTAIIAFRYGPFQGIITGLLSNILGPEICNILFEYDLRYLMDFKHFALVNALCGLGWGILPRLSGWWTKLELSPLIKLKFAEILNPRATYKSMMIRTITIGSIIAILSWFSSSLIYQHYLTDQGTQSEGPAASIDKISETIHFLVVGHSQKNGDEMNALQENQIQHQTSPRPDKTELEKHRTLSLFIINIFDKTLVTCIAFYFLTTVITKKRHNFNNHKKRNKFKNKYTIPGFFIKNSILYNSYEIQQRKQDGNLRKDPIKSRVIKDVYEDIIKLMIALLTAIYIYLAVYVLNDYHSFSLVETSAMKPGSLIFLFLTTIRYTVVAFVRFFEPQEH